MLKNDRWIKEQAQAGMITPFQAGLVREVQTEIPRGCSAKRRKKREVLSFGTSSYGYDIRLSPKEFLTFRHVPGTVMDPKRANPANLEPATLHHTDALNLRDQAVRLCGGTLRVARVQDAT